MDLKECKRKGLIKRTTKNIELIKSLIEISHTNEATVKEAKITERNVTSYILLAYDSLRQILEAICIMKGYKVLSHICIEELLRDVLPEFDYIEFDRLRWIRNSISYYGNKVEFKQGKEIIKKMLLMKNELLKKYLKEYDENPTKNQRRLQRTTHMKKHSKRLKNVK
ncbi:MAG: hypothetical protein J7K22_04240 [Nanoarchaeota archaeon]|nr:hypothetical protein [Nanoarchaeota archaeon]